MPTSDPDGTLEGNPRSYALDRLTWREVRTALDLDSRLLVAVGALEQHGPHLPLGTGTYLAERVVEEVSRLEGILRAPTVRYGVVAGGQDRYAGTAGVSRKSLHRTMNELLAAWEDHGVRELVVVTAQRYEPHLDALLMALTSEATTTVVDLHSIPVGDLLDGDPEGEHAGELDTSLLLHLAPERVRRDAVVDFRVDRDTLRKYVRGRAPTPPEGSEGLLGSPSRGTAEKGRAVFERWIRTLRERVLRGTDR